MTGLSMSFPDILFIAHKESVGHVSEVVVRPTACALSWLLHVILRHFRRLLAEHREGKRVALAVIILFQSGGEDAAGGGCVKQCHA